MPDLYDVVKEFISQNLPSQQLDSEPQQSQPLTQSQLNNSPAVATIQTAGLNQNITLTEEDFGIVIPEYLECLKSETNELSKYEDIEITVKEPKKVDNGFFSKTYVNFLITTNPININVRRKHDDFVWLRERLCILFNLNILPRLPKKGKVNEDKHINKRMRNYERFLVYLAKDPLVKNSQIFFDFLTIENEQDFEKRKKIYNRLRTPVELKDIKTIDGKMRINVTIKKEKLLENIRDNSAFNETALKKFNQNFKLLKEEMKTVIARVLSFGPLFDKLIKISSTFFENNVILESYNQMKNIFNTWAETLKKQNTFFFTDVKEYLRLLSGNYHHLRDLVQYVEKIKLNYSKVSKNLTNKKMELFRKGDMSSWQLDAKDKENINSFYSDRLASYKKICFKETNNVIKQKEKYGYHLNKLISEYQRLRSINTIEHKAKVIQFSQKESEITSNYAKMMGNIVAIMENCVVDNTNKEEIDMVQNVTSPVDMNMGEDKNIQKNEIVENPNRINTDGFEDKKEEIRNEIEIIEEKKEHKIEEIKNEIKEEKENEINNVKKEENVEEKKENVEKEEKVEEKKEEEKAEDKPEIKNEEKINEDKKEENDNVDKKEEIKEEKKEEQNEEKKEEE